MLLDFVLLSYLCNDVTDFNILLTDNIDIYKRKSKLY